MFTGLVSIPLGTHAWTDHRVCLNPPPSVLLPFEYAPLPPQIEHVARIAKITPTSGSTGFYFRIDNASPILDDCHVGDSICVNGACLTVTEFGADYFDVNLANETLKRTNLGTPNGSYRSVA